MNIIAQIYRDLTPIIPVQVTYPITAQAKAESIRRMIYGVVQPGDLIELGYGVFDFGSAAPLIFPPGVTVRGMGPGLTMLKSQWFDWDGDKRVAFQLSQRTLLESLSLWQASLDDTVDGICCGFESPGISATLRNIAIGCPEWALYGWQADATLLCEDFLITTGRVGIASENSGDGQNFTFRRGLVIGDASLSKCIYDVGNPNNGGIFGVVHRGGDLRMNGVEFQIKGLPAGGPRACAITDTGGDNSTPAGNTRYELYGVQSRVDPNGCDPARCWDLDVQTDYVRPNVREQGCWGGGKDGALSRSY